MAEYEDREHYIPLRKSDLVQLLLSDKKLPLDAREDFKQFCKLISAVFHFEYLERLERLKDAFAPFDPDTQTRPLKPLSLDQKEKRLDELFAEALLDRKSTRLNSSHSQISYAVFCLKKKKKTPKKLTSPPDSPARFTTKPT